MFVIRGLIAALALAAVVVAGVVISHGTHVKNAGQTIGYVPPAESTSLAVIGDSYSSGTGMGGNSTANWGVQLGTLYRMQFDGGAAVAGSGYVAHPSGKNGETFGQQIKTVLGKQPSWLVMWGAFDDLAANKSVSEVESAYTTTLTTLMTQIKKDHLNTHVVVVGPVWEPGVPTSLAGNHQFTFANVKKLNAFEQALATRLGGLKTDGTTKPPKHNHAPYKNRLNYINAVNWFRFDNSSLIGIDREHPIDLGHSYIAYQMQQHLVNFGLDSTAPQVSSVVPPYIHATTATITPSTHTTTTKVRITQSHTQTVHVTQRVTVQAPPTVITVTAAGATQTP